MAVGDVTVGPVVSVQVTFAERLFALNFEATNSGGLGFAMEDNTVSFAERTAPAGSPTNEVRLFAADDGGGKTQLQARFNTGAIQVVAAEP